MPLTFEEEQTRLDFETAAIAPQEPFPMREAIRQLHIKMQNPIDGVVDLSNASNFHGYCRQALSNYYTLTGEHLFGKNIEVLLLANTKLASNSVSAVPVNPANTSNIHYITDLIRKNPSIKRLDLSYTQISEADARSLINALQKNTHLIELNVSGNPISQPLLNQIEQLIERNINAVLAKNQRSLYSRCLGISQTLFSAMPINQEEQEDKEGYKMTLPSSI